MPEYIDIIVNSNPIVVEIEAGGQRRVAFDPSFITEFPDYVVPNGEVMYFTDGTYVVGDGVTELADLYLHGQTITVPVDRVLFGNGTGYTHSANLTFKMNAGFPYLYVGDGAGLVMATDSVRSYIQGIGLNNFTLYSRNSACSINLSVFGDVTYNAVNHVFQGPIWSGNLKIEAGVGIGSAGDAYFTNYNSGSGHIFRLLTGQAIRVDAAGLRIADTGVIHLSNSYPFEVGTATSFARWNAATVGGEGLFVQNNSYNIGGLSPLVTSDNNGGRTIAFGGQFGATHGNIYATISAFNIYAPTGAMNITASGGGIVDIGSIVRVGYTSPPEGKLHIHQNMIGGAAVFVNNSINLGGRPPVYVHDGLFNYSFGYTSDNIFHAKYYVDAAGLHISINGSPYNKKIILEATDMIRLACVDVTIDGALNIGGTHSVTNLGGGMAVICNGNVFNIFQGNAAFIMAQFTSVGSKFVAPVGNVGLDPGQVYKDTRANIEGNADYFLAMKA